MKKILLTLAGFIVTFLSIAQSPNLMNYQGVARNAAGNVLPNQSISLRLSILTGSPTGASVYSETRTLLTNAFGLFNVVVGSPGATNVVGTIAGINWTAFGAGSGNKYLQVEIDPVGGASFVNVGSTQLVSVPYALNAGGAAPVGPAGGDLSGTYPNPTVAKLQGRAVSAAAPGNKNLLMWDAGTVSWIPATAAQAGIVSGTGTLNTVPKWTPDGVTLGNSKIFDDGTFVGIGTTTPGAGLVVSGNGIWNSAIGIQNTGTGMEWRMNVSGTTFGITKIPGSTFTPLQLFSTGGMDLSNSAGTSIARLLDNGDVGIGTTTPVDKFHVVKNNSGMVLGGGANTGSEAKFLNSGTSHMSIYNRGNNALTFAQTSALSQTNTLGAELMTLTSAGDLGVGIITPGARIHSVTTSGDAVLATNTGTSGRGGTFQVTNASNVSDAIRAETNGSGASWGIRAISTGTNGAGLFQQTNTANNANNVQSINAGLGRAGLFVSNNAASAANTLEATNVGSGNAFNASTSGTGTAVRISNSNAANTSITTLITNAEASNNAAPNGSLLAVRGAILAGTQYLVSDLSANPLPTAIGGISSAGIGLQGSSVTGFGTAGISNSGFGVVGVSVLPTGSGLGGIALGGGYALQTQGRLQFQGQGAATNRIMGATNAAGDATWRTAASLGLASIPLAGGTLNYVPKWTPDGTTLGNSLAFDNGGTHSIGSTTPTTDIFYVSNPGFNTWANINQVGTNVGGVSFTRANVYKYDIAMNGANDFYINNYTSGNRPLTILAANGNVGINQVNPAATLDVNGSFKLTDGSQAAGKVLTSNATGVASWQDLITPNVGISLRDLTSPQSIPGTGSNTVINTWATAIYEDGGANFNGATGEYTISVTGLFEINASVDWASFANPATLIGANIQVNGITVSTSYANEVAAGDFPSTIANNYQVKLTAGDVVRIGAFQNSGAPVSLTFSGRSTRFNVKLLSR